MFVIPPLAFLFAFVFLRPHEVVDVLRPVTIGSVFVVIAVAYALDRRIRVNRPQGSPLLTTLVAFFLFCAFSLAMKSADTLAQDLALYSSSLLGFLAISQGIQSVRALGSAAVVLLTITIILAALGVHQGLQQSICYQRGNATHPEVPDGRPCDGPQACRENGGVPGGEYYCEHPGMFGTRSVGGRVRFLGFLEDPNEFAMALCMGAPLAVPFYERRRTLFRLGVIVVTTVLSAIAVIMTKSRSGQLSLMAGLGVYFLQRFGKPGLVVAGLTSLPLLMLGGRSGEEAESSSIERLECWAEALSLWSENPFFGVGFGKFTEHHFLTAHNSFMLTLSELGPLGLLLWIAALYICFKITIRAQLDFAGRRDAFDAKSWGLALSSSLAGMVISVFFLSVVYKPTTWVYLGVVAAFYATVRKHEPSWRVRFGWRDLGAVLLIAILMVAGIAAYIRFKNIG